MMATVGHDGFLRVFNYHSQELIAVMKSYFGEWFIVKKFKFCYCRWVVESFVESRCKIHRNRRRRRLVDAVQRLRKTSCLSRTGTQKLDQPGSVWSVSVCHRRREHRRAQYHNDDDNGWCSEGTESWTRSVYECRPECGYLPRGFNFFPVLHCFVQHDRWRPAEKQCLLSDRKRWTRYVFMSMGHHPWNARSAECSTASKLDNLCADD